MAGSFRRTVQLLGKPSCFFRQTLEKEAQLHSLHCLVMAGSFRRSAQLRGKPSCFFRQILEKEARLHSLKQATRPNVGSLLWSGCQQIPEGVPDDQHESMASTIFLHLALPHPLFASMVPTLQL